MILDICDSPEILKTIKLIKLVVSIIRVIVPILLIFTASKSLMSAVRAGESASSQLKKTSEMFGAAIAVFLVPTYVNFLLNVTNSKYNDCFNNATKEGISNAYYNIAKNNVVRSKETLRELDYNQAVNYLKNVDDETRKEELSSILSETKKYIDIVKDIETLSSKNFTSKTKELEETINSVSDKSVKDKLTGIYNEKRDSVYKSIGNYPIVPFGEIDQYKNLKYMSNTSLSSILEKNGSSVEELNDKIKAAVEIAGPGTREGVVAAAITLIGNLADTGYRLTYFWGGKRNNFGVDGTWGLRKSNPYCNDHYFDTQEGIDHCNKDMSYWGMDCSGFVNWAVVNGTQRKASQGETNNGTKISMNSSTADHAVCEIGDALATTGHIVLVVGLDDENKRYIIAEESNGLEIRSVPYNGNRGGKAYYCKKLDHNYQ